MKHKHNTLGTVAALHPFMHAGAIMCCIFGGHLKMRKNSLGGLHTKKSLLAWEQESPQSWVM
jgi:hypothetical protein